MKFGVREICDVVLKAKATQKVGNKTFYKGEPVIYFDTLKTSSLEGAATTNYATGGRGNARLMAWEGERTLTFSMEDALISPIGFMILSGAGLVEAGDKTPIYVHSNQTVSNFTLEGDTLTLSVDVKPYLPKNATEDYIYIMALDENGEVISEPFIGTEVSETADDSGNWTITVKKMIVNGRDKEYDPHSLSRYKDKVKAFLVDFYQEKTSNVQQIEITPDKFGGNYYLEASTLFRNTAGVDMPAEFIIPNCKIQSNFTFTMTSSGDPSTFNFVMDAFPDYTRFDPEKKVLAAIQIIDAEAELSDSETKRRMETNTYEEPDTDESAGA